MPIVSHNVTVVAYDDATTNSNPQFRFFDWRRSSLNIAVSNPLEARYSILPGASQTLFSGTRSTAIDSTSAFQISLNPANNGVYRITNTGGTAPGFRTNRGLTLSGDTVAISVNNNATASVTVTTNNFSTVQVGDTVFIPNTLTGDAALSSPFNIQNGGYWTVVSKASGGTPKSITLIRPAGTSFMGVSETVTLTNSAQFVAFSSSGVQVGDTLEISSGFSIVTQSSFEVLNVTPTWVEFNSTASYPLETGVLPGSAGMTFYLSTKRYVRIESDQEIAIRFNNDVGGVNQNIRVVPRTVGTGNVGWFEIWGTVWALEVQNRSATTSATVTIHSAE